LSGRSWRELEASRAEIVEQAEARVERWVWASADAQWERPELLWPERQGRRPVEGAYDTPPSRLDAAAQYGFDDAGGVAIARVFSLRDGLPRRLHSETVALPSDPEQRILAEFHVDHPPQLDRPRGIHLLSLTRSRMEGEAVAEVETWWSRDWPGSPGGRCRELYEYDADGTLVGIVSEIDRPGERVSRTLFEPSFDDDGELLLLKAKTEDAPEEQSEDGFFVVYRRSSPSAVREALRFLERELPERVASWVERTAPRAPVYALAIAYDQESVRPLPPALGLAGQEQLAAGSGVDPWNPAEFECFDEEPSELLDDELLSACQALNQEWASTLADDQPQKLLVECAKRLAGRDWSAQLHTTGELAVYAVDLELEDLERNLRASVPPDVVQRIEQTRQRSGG
jgi:hypothetical protein